MALFDKSIRQREAVIERFEEAWLSGDRPVISDYLPVDAEAAQDLLVELVLIDAERRRASQETVTVDQYVGSFPTLGRNNIFLAEFESEMLRASEKQTAARKDPDKSSNSMEEKSALPKLGRFELLKEEASGSFGTVYRARDTSLGRIVAIKVLQTGALAGSDERKRFAREAQHVAKLDHPGIVPIHEIGQTDGIAYLVSEFVEGKTLAEALANAAFSPGTAVEIMAQIADALEHAHRQGVVHRDMKPSNVMLQTLSESEGAKNEGSGSWSRRKVKLPYRVRIMDFGLARQLDSDESLTAEGQLLGTAAYMSPEQAAGLAKEADGRSDVFSLGVIFYEFLVGGRPFVGQHREVLLQNIQYGEPASIRSIAAKIPCDLETICLKCLRKSPQRRYQSAAELSADLRRWQNNKPISARSAGIAERTSQAVCRRPMRWLAITAVFLFATSLIVGLQWHNFQLLKESQRANASAADARRRLYVSNMNLASEAWRQQRVGRVRELLEPFQNPGQLEDIRGWEWNYLWAQSHSEERVIQAHDQPIVAAAFSADERFWASATESGVLKLWNAPAGTEYATLAHTGPTITALVFAGGSRRLIVGRSNGTIQIWNVSDGTQITEFHGHDGDVRWLASDSIGTLFVSAGSDRRVRVWDAKTGELGWTLQAYIQEIAQVTFDPHDSSKLLVLTADGVIRMWQQNTEQETQVIRSDTARYTRFAISPQGDSLAVVSDDGRIVIIDRDNGRAAIKWETADQPVELLVFDHSGSFLISASFGAILQVWDVENGTLLQTALGHQDQISNVSFSNNDKLLVSASYDGSFRIWANLAIHTQANQNNPSPAILRLRPYASEHTLAAINREGQLVIFDFSNHVEPKSLHFQNGETLRAVDFSHSAQLLASGDDFGNVVLWDTVSGIHLRRIATKRNPVSALRLYNDGERLVTGSTDGSVTIWDTTTGQRLVDLKTEDNNRINAIDVVGDGSQIAAVSKNGSLHLWDMETSELAMRLIAHRGAANDVVLSYDGSLVATVGSDQLVRLWDVKSKRQLLTLSGHTRQVRCVCFSPNGRRIVTGDDSGSLRMWDTKYGEMLLEIKCPDERWRQITFSMNDSMLIGAGASGVMHCFDPSGPLAKRSAYRQYSFPSSDGAWKLNTESWSIVRWPGASSNRYDHALKLAERASELIPQEPWIQLTLGVAYYRTHQFERALPILQEAKTSLGDNRYPAAFEVMVATKLGDMKLAELEFEEIHSAAQVPFWRADPGFSRHFCEASALVRGPGVQPISKWTVRCYSWRHTDEIGSPKLFRDVISNRPLLQLTAERLTFNWNRNSPGAGVPHDFFATVSLAEFDLVKGKYEIQVVSKNGVRVYQDDQLVVDNWNPSVSKIGLHSIDWPGGICSWRVEHYKSQGPANLDFRIFSQSSIP